MPDTRPFALGVLPMLTTLLTLIGLALWLAESMHSAYLTATEAPSPWEF